MLNVPTKGMEETVLAVGGCSGKDLGDKMRHLGIGSCFPGWGCAQPKTTKRKGKADSGSQNPGDVSGPGVGVPAVSDCIAHAVCTVQSIQDPPDGASRQKPRGDAGRERPAGHALIFGRIERAYVRAGWWDGRNFAPRRSDLPPFLTFLGSKRFAYVRPE